MGEIHKTDTARSPLLQPVIQRDYTKGFSALEPDAVPAPPPTPEQKAPGQSSPPPPTPPPGPSPNYTAPPEEDYTRPFSFDEEVDSASDLADGEGAQGVTMPAGSAKAFANFAGNAIQQYLPKLTYGYVKIDIENVIVNVEKGNLTHNWIDVFTKINDATEKGLAIPDESIKMWKSAFKEYLEYKNITAANPETAFWAATALLLGDQGVRAYSIKKTNERYMAEAIQASNPGLFEKQSSPPPQQQASSNNNQNSKPNETGTRAA